MSVKLKKIGVVGSLAALVPVPGDPELERTISYLAGVSREAEKGFSPEQHKEAKRMYEAIRAANMQTGKPGGLDVQAHVLIVALLQVLKRMEP